MRIHRKLVPSVCLSAVLLAGLWLGYASARNRYGHAVRYGSIAPVVASDATVVTLLHYMESGRAHVTRFVNELPPEQAAAVREVVARAEAACVRVELTTAWAPGHVETVHSSGVLVEGGRHVLTAGHLLDPAGEGDLVVRLVTGRKLAARVVDWEPPEPAQSAGDWTLLEVQGISGLEAGGVDIGSVSLGDLVLCLGYPGQVGLDSNGDVALDGPGDSEFLAPIVTVACIDGLAPLRLTPVAGAVPVGGMSGAPVLDLAGRLVGLFVSVTTTARGSGAEFHFNAVPVAPLRTRLRLDARR